MLNNIHVEHYKAFEEADVPIKPITILLGANSVGKSSIIHLLLSMEQTATVDSGSYISCLKLFGKAVNMGSAENIFRKFDTNKPIKLAFTINDDKLLYRLKNEFKEHLNELFSLRYLDYSYIKGSSSKKNSFSRLLQKVLNPTPEIMSKEEYMSIIRLIKDSFLEKGKKAKKSSNYFFRFGLIGQIVESDNSIIERLYDYFIALNQLSKANFDFVFKIKLEDRSTLAIDSFDFLCGDKTLFSYSSSSDKTNFSSDPIKFSTVEKKYFKQCFNDKNTIFSCFSEVDDQRFNNEGDIITTHIIKIVNEALSTLHKTFNSTRINHVSPLRANPKRYYMLDKANVTYSLDTFDGDAMAEVLKEKKELKRQVNRWLDNFKLSVDVEEIKEVLHHLKVKQNGLKLDITDVGFGISQVLPIIIQGFLSKEDSLTIIEQPEIHLHPKMQADLADLFIDMINTSEEKVVMIETHSEYLLRRLRRRISEGKIAADKVSICLFHPQTNEQGAIIEHLNIEEKGSFEWPREFYDGELKKDITEYLKRQE